MTLVPISVFGAFLGLLNPIREREAIRQGMTDTARALSLAVDRQARIAITGLQALATSPSLLDGDYTRFRKQVEQFLTSHDGWISVVDETGQQYLNTRIEPTAPLPRTDNREWLEHIFGSQRRIRHRCRNRTRGEAAIRGHIASSATRLGACGADIIDSTRNTDPTLAGAASARGLDRCHCRQ